MHHDRKETLRDIRSRARALILFTYRMENDTSDALDSAQIDRDMSMARAHTKGLYESVEDFLMVAQPKWYKLSPLEQSAAIKNAFNVERALQRERKKNA